MLFATLKSYHYSTITLTDLVYNEYWNYGLEIMYLFQIFNFKGMIIVIFWAFQFLVLKFSVHYKLYHHDIQIT